MLILIGKRYRVQTSSVICTLAISRYLWPDLDSHSLGAMMYTLMPQDEARAMVRGAHCASDDVKMTIVLLDEILIAAYGPGTGLPKGCWRHRIALPT